MEHLSRGRWISGGYAYCVRLSCDPFLSHEHPLFHTALLCPFSPLFFLQTTTSIPTTVRESIEQSEAVVVLSLRGCAQDLLSNRLSAA